MKTNIVVGAGLSGIVIANLLATLRNEKVLIVDRRTNIGGNCYDYRDKNGIMVQKFGSHFFHTSNEKVWNYLKHFTDFNQYMHKVLSVIDGVETVLPFNLKTLHDIFPSSLANNLETKLLEKYGFGKKVSVTELRECDDADLKFLGEYVYEKAFLPNAVKQYGQKAEDVDACLASEYYVYISKDNRYSQDKYQGIPLDGYTAMLERMIMHPNIELRLGIDYKEVTAKFDRTFFTGSIDEYFDYEFGQLPYRSVVWKLEEHDKDYYQANSVIDYPENYDFVRVHEYKHYLNDKSQKTVIAKEYAVGFELGRTERAYPLSTLGAELYQKYQEKAKSLKNVYFLGRLGDYKYYNMDEAVARAIEVFEGIGKN